MSEIYKAVRALADGKSSDDDNELIDEWLSENSGEWSDHGLWLDDDDLRSIESYCEDNREWLADSILELEGSSEERVEAVRAGAPFTDAERIFLREHVIRTKSENGELDEGTSVYLTEFKHSRCKTVWLLYAASGGGWGIVEWEILGAFFQRQKAVDSLREDGYTDL
jgi:hypothetical protein